MGKRVEGRGKMMGRVRSERGKGEENGEGRGVRGGRGKMMWRGSERGKD